MDWDIQVIVDGVDRTAQASGRVWRRQEANAAHLCRVALSVPSGQDMAVDELIGKALVVNARVDGGAWSTRFSGTVSSATTDTSAGLLRLRASDRLQQHFEAMDLPAILAAMPGGRWNSALYANGGERSDGWRQAQDVMGTLPYSYHIDRGGTHRWLPWAAGAIDATLDAAGIYLDGIDIRRPGPRERINKVTLTLEVRGPILYDWAYACSVLVVPVGAFCDYFLADSSDTPQGAPTSMLEGAIRSGGNVRTNRGALGSGIGAGGGIGYTLFPPTGWYSCDGGGGTYIPVYWWSGVAGQWAAGASWTWDTKWAQTLSMRYEIVVQAPDSIAAYSEELQEGAALLSSEDDFGDWGQGDDATEPDGVQWEDAGAIKRWIAVDAAEEAAFLETGIAEAVVEIEDSHRAWADVQCPPSSAALAIEIGDTVSAAAQSKGATAVVGAIEEVWDIDGWDAQIALTLRPSRCPGSGGTSDAVAAPSRPDLTAPVTLDTSRVFPTRVGGKASSPPYDGAWDGVTVNVKSPVGGSEEYPTRAVFGRPEVPASLRDEWVAQSGALVYNVFPPHESVTETAE